MPRPSTKRLGYNLGCYIPSWHPICESLWEASDRHLMLKDCLYLFCFPQKKRKNCIASHAVSPTVREFVPQIYCLTFLANIHYLAQQDAVFGRFSVPFHNVCLGWCLVRDASVLLVCLWISFRQRIYCVQAEGIWSVPCTSLKHVNCATSRLLWSLGWTL